MKISSILKSDGLLLFISIIWGSTYVAQRWGMDHVEPFMFNACRFGIGAVLLVPFAMRWGRRSNVTAVPRWISLLAGVSLFAGATLQQIGLKYTTAGKAGFITGLYVVLVPILGMVIGRSTRLSTWLGMLIAVAGMYLLCIQDALVLAKGDLLVFIGAGFWAVHLLVLSYVAKSANPLSLAVWQNGICAGLSLLVSLGFEQSGLTAIRGAMGAILYAGILSVALGFTLQIVAQKHAPPAHAAIILSLEALFALLAGLMFLGETIAMRGMIGCGLLLLAMLVSQDVFTPSRLKIE